MPTLRERFWAKVVRTETCWVWKGAIKKRSPRRTSAGGDSVPHGVFWLSGKTRGAHRVSFAIEHIEGWDGDLSKLDSLPLIAHACDNPACVRPSHLEPSDHSNNLLDAWARGRRDYDMTEAMDELESFFDQVAG